MAFKMRGTPYTTKSPLEHSGPWNDAAYLKKHKEAWGEDHSDHGNLLAKDGGKKESVIEKAGQTLIKKAGKSPMRQGPFHQENIETPRGKKANELSNMYGGTWGISINKSTGRKIWMNEEGLNPNQVRTKQENPNLPTVEGEEGDWTTASSVHNTPSDHGSRVIGDKYVWE